MLPAEFADQAQKAVADGYFTFDSIVDSYTQCFAVPIARPEDGGAATLCLVAPKAGAMRNHADYLQKVRVAAAALEPSFA